MGQAPEILRPTGQLETSLLGQFLHTEAVYEGRNDIKILRYQNTSVTGTMCDI